MKRITCLFVLGVCALSMGATCNVSTGLGGAGGTDSPDNSSTTDGSKLIPAFMPTGISMDVSELPSQGDPTSRDKGDTSLQNPGPIGRTLRSAERIVQNFHRMADHAVIIGAKIRHDMTDPTQTQVTGTFDEGKATYKADFAAFDFDGDGTPDGSGNAIDTPVALRVWADRGNGYQRVFCALITTKPSGDNFGAGRVCTHPGAAREDDPVDLQISVQWDRTDSAHKWNDAFMSGQLQPDLKLHDGHARVDVRSGDTADSLEKTVRSATNFADNPYGLDTYQSSVHFKPGSGYALIDATAAGSGGTIDLTDVCVDLAGESTAGGSQCDSFDKQDMAFIDLPTGNETAFPADFPEQPTFDTTTTGG